MNDLRVYRVEKRKEFSPHSGKCNQGIFCNNIDLNRRQLLFCMLLTRVSKRNKKKREIRVESGLTGYHRERESFSALSALAYENLC